jgi:hypothetical protein
MMGQNMDPVAFITEFADRIYHVDSKDTGSAAPTVVTASPGPTCPGGDPG